MLSYNEIKPRKYITLDGDPYEVLDSHVFRKQQRKPVNQTKLKNLLTDKVIEHSFHQSDKVEEALIDTTKLKFLYRKKDEFWFAHPDDPSDRHLIAEDIVGDTRLYMKEGDVVDVEIYDGSIIGIKLPIKVELEVTEAPPNIKGNTETGGNKNVTLETDAIISTPLFIEAGDIVEVNTETGEYVTRIEKK